MLRLQDTGRIRESGGRFVANFGPISQIIKNMPEDKDKRGRLRDHLAMLLEGAKFRLQALEMDEELARLVTHSKQALQEIESMQKEQKQTAMKIMDEVMKQLEESFLTYGLNEDQENLLMNVVQNGVDRSLDNFEKGLNIDKQLRGIIDRLLTFSKT